MSVAQVTRHKLTVAEYYKLGEFLAPEARVELIAGEIYEMAPIGSEHAECVDWLGDQFRLALSQAYRVRRQNPLRLDQHSEPEPDLCVVKPRTLSYRQAHPGPEDVLLLVEVADHSLTFDRGVKLPLYASHNIPETWIVNLRDRMLEVYTEPVDGLYQRELRLRMGEVRPVLLSEVAVSVEALFQAA